MPRVMFDRLPDQSRLWIFGLSRELEPNEENFFLAAVDEFLETWIAHGKPLRCGRDWRHKRFLLMAVDQASEPPSGCSVDTMIDLLKNQEKILGISIVDNSSVWFLKEGKIKKSSRQDFKFLVKEGKVNAKTIVFDNTVISLAKYRTGHWERPALETWHQKAFFPDFVCESSSQD